MLLFWKPISRTFVDRMKKGLSVYSPRKSDYSPRKWDSAKFSYSLLFEILFPKYFYFWKPISRTYVDGTGKCVYFFLGGKNIIGGSKDWSSKQIELEAELTWAFSLSKPDYSSRKRDRTSFFVWLTFWTAVFKIMLFWKFRTRMSVEGMGNFFFIGR